MIQERIKYSALITFIMGAVAVFLTSFSPLFPASPLPNENIIPIYNSISTTESGSYSPEFNLRADSVVIPMKRAGRLFLIEATVDGEKGNLVFDTGANGLVLNNTYFRNHVKSGGVSSTGITGAVGMVEQISVGKIEFADLTYNNLRADVANLGHIENRRGIKILGLLGFSMIKDLEIVIDSENSELKLFRIDKKGNRLNNSSPVFKPDYVQKIEGNSNILFLKGTIGGKPLNFCFDTGAETNAISSDSNKKIMSTLTITRRTALKGAGSAGSEVLFGRMNDFVIGNQPIPNMETIITNLDALSEAYGTHIDGMLGYSFLEHGIICVNFVNKQFGIRFTKGEEK
jgi:predicted aspartyl protease